MSSRFTPLFGTRRIDIGKLVAKDIGVIIVLSALISMPLAAVAIARNVATFTEQTPLAFWSLGIASVAASITVALAAGRQTWIAGSEACGGLARLKKPLLSL